MSKNRTFQVVVAYNDRRQVLHVTARDKRDAIRKATVNGALVIEVKVK